VNIYSGADQTLLWTFAALPATPDSSYAQVMAP
jgi:hypothetical protein